MTLTLAVRWQSGRDVHMHGRGVHVNGSVWCRGLSLDVGKARVHAPGPVALRSNLRAGGGVELAGDLVYRGAGGGAAVVAGGGQCLRTQGSATCGHGECVFGARLSQSGSCRCDIGWEGPTCAAERGLFRTYEGMNLSVAGRCVLTPSGPPPPPPPALQTQWERAEWWARAGRAARCARMRGGLQRH
jgi:hypothetical protein